MASDRMENKPSYELTIAMATLDGLGRNLYSNSAAVLAELIANAWDADATEVRIVSDGQGKDQTITVIDNGCGMSEADLNDRFLTIGYRKRAVTNEGEVSPVHHRPFMGRKGIGKLSVFSMADTLTVISRKEGEKPAGLEINYPAVEEHCKTSPHEPYKPKPLTGDELDMQSSVGTTIILSNLRRPFDGRSETPLRTRIARRFDVFGGEEHGGFSVTINGREIGYEDRQDLKRCEYVWLLGGYTLPKGATKAEIFEIPDTEITGAGIPKDARIQGWIGAVSSPSALTVDGDTESLRNIIVLARRRPIQEGVIDQLNFHQIFANYATGQIIADFLDAEGHEDIATSDRQRLLESDPRVRALKEKLAEIFKKASQQWSNVRSKNKLKSSAFNEPLEAWLTTIRRRDDAEIARKLLGTVAALHLDDEAERVHLFQGAILAFDRTVKLGEMRKIEDVVSNNFDAQKLLSLLADYQAHEEHVYGRMVRDRLNVIERLRGLLEGHELENRTRDFIAQHPWLLNPAWERATQNPSTEKTFKRVAKEMGIQLGDDVADQTSRFDMAFLDGPRGPLIIEFKRPGRAISYGDLSDQILRYGRVMTKILADDDALHQRPGAAPTAMGIDSRIQFAVILDHVVQGGGPIGIDQINAQLRPFACEAFTFDQMLSNAYQRYVEYERLLKNDSVSDVLRSLDSPSSSHHEGPNQGDD